MWQKKENTNREPISMEEYLNKRKSERKEREKETLNPLGAEGGQWIWAELYM